tara:strand:+ start:85 stop:666 length:582 start_codon:yes stop_codon:yes gene_type:complete
MIIHEGYNRVIYIHIPRTGGRYVTAYFKNHHITESDYDTFIDDHFCIAHSKINYYKNYDFKNFTVVRNPYTRFISTLKRCLPECNLPLNVFENVTNYKTFIKYLNKMKNMNGLGQFFEKQINFINDDTYIWKLEYGLHDSFLKWLKDNFDLNINIRDPKYLAWPRDFNKVKVSKKVESFIKKYYKEDYEKFKY